MEQLNYVKTDKTCFTLLDTIQGFQTAFLQPRDFLQCWAELSSCKQNYTYTHHYHDFHHNIKLLKKHD